MRIIKYYEHTVNPGEVVPLRLHALEEIIADSVCKLLSNVYKAYGDTVVKIEFKRADVQYVYCNHRCEATFGLDLSRNNGMLSDAMWVTINYNTNELISIESTVGSAFNRELFKPLSFRLMENKKEKKGMKIMISLDEFESICKKVMLKSLYENQFEIDKVIINNPAMIVFWKDCTKTVVTARDEEFDPEKGLAMAFAKKALGNNYAAGGKFKAKLKHAQVIKGKEESNKTKATDTCNEVSEGAKKPAEKKMTKTAWVKMMMSEMGYTRKQASEAWDQNHK